MSSEAILITSIFSSLSTSAVLWWWLKDALRSLLGQLCHRGGDTEFWARYTLLMLVIAPLAIVVWFVPNFPQSATNALRHLMLSILFSHFLAFALVGRTLYKAVGQTNDNSTPLLSKQG
jgi:hypothetical protein